MWVLGDYDAGSWLLLAATVVEQDQGDLFLSYEESLEPVGRPCEDLLFASTFLQALSLALRHLPARELGRIKSVSRSWRAVIESDRFAVSHNDHHRRADASAPCLAAGVFFTCSPPMHELVVVPLGSCLSASDDDDGLRPLVLPPLVYSRRGVFVSKPCHGLALVSCRGWCQLFNPVTRAYRDLLVRFSFGNTPDPDEDKGSSIGLGYDQSRQQHFLVLLATTPRGRMECKVWRLGDDREARPAPAPPVPAAVDVPPVYDDDDGGRIYWMCRSPRAILAFGIVAEAFDVVPPPPLAAAGDGSTEALVDLKAKKKLCVVQSCPSTETMTVWSAAASSSSRPDGGKTWWWTREYVVELRRWPEFSPKMVELVMPMAIDDGRILLDTGRSLGYYDPVQRTLETLYSLRLPSDKRFFVAALCWEESLVRPYDRCKRFRC